AGGRAGWGGNNAAWGTRRRNKPLSPWMDLSCYEDQAGNPASRLSTLNGLIFWAIWRTALPEIQPADEVAGLTRRLLPVHAGVLQLGGERAAVTGVIQRPDDLLEVQRAATGRAEVPVAPGVSEFRMAAEHAGLGGLSR